MNTVADKKTHVLINKECLDELLKELDEINMTTKIIKYVSWQWLALEAEFGRNHVVLGKDGGRCSFSGMNPTARNELTDGGYVTSSTGIPLIEEYGVDEPTTPVSTTPVPLIIATFSWLAEEAGQGRIHICLGTNGERCSFSGRNPSAQNQITHCGYPTGASARRIPVIEWDGIPNLDSLEKNSFLANLLDSLEKNYPVNTDVPTSSAPTPIRMVSLHWLLREFLAGRYHLCLGKNGRLCSYGARNIKATDTLLASGHGLFSKDDKANIIPVVEYDGEPDLSMVDEVGEDSDTHLTPTLQSVVDELYTLRAEVDDQRQIIEELTEYNKHIRNRLETILNKAEEIL